MWFSAILNSTTYNTTFSARSDWSYLLSWCWLLSFEIKIVTNNSKFPFSKWITISYTIVILFLSSFTSSQLWTPSPSHNSQSQHRLQNMPTCHLIRYLSDWMENIGGREWYGLRLFFSKILQLDKTSADWQKTLPQTHRISDSLQTVPVQPGKRGKGSCLSVSSVSTL